MICFDLETYPIGPKKAPTVIVGAMNVSHEDADMYRVKEWSTLVKDLPEEERSIYFFWADKLEHFISFCELVRGPIVAHNGAFDWSCISAMDSSFIGRIYDLFSKRKIQCTFLRTMIYLNSKGVLKTYQNKKVELEHGKFGNLSYVGSVFNFCGADISEKKDGDVQVTYYKVKGIEPKDWPEAYREYLIQDVEWLPRLFDAQEHSKYVKHLSTGKKIDIYKEAPRRSAFHYSLTLASAWGLKVDKDAVNTLRMESETKVQVVADEMVSEGFAKELEGVKRQRALEKGKLTITLDNKKIQQVVEESYTSRGLEVPRTDKGNVNTSRKTLERSGHPLLEKWAKVGNEKTIWSTFIPALEKSFDTNGVLNTNYFPYSDTGRVSARNPNLLNPPRAGGIRECIIAREGCCFVFCDYEANELRVLSQVLLDMLGSSKLASLYQEDPFFDPHTYMATRKLGISYQEGKELKKAGDKELKKTRQLMKACNFGFPGGMASRSFTQYAQNYGVKITESEADDLKAFFFQQFPEIKKYLNRVSKIIRTGGSQGYLPRAQRFSGDRSYCQLANFHFQGLAAEGGLTAFTQVSKLAYTDPSSALYGTRPVLFVHDEIILETPLIKAHDAALELQKVMQDCMQIFTPNVPSVAEPTLATRWWKDAYQKFDENGRLIPSDL